MRQWLELDPLVAFTLRRVEARGWHVSVHRVNNKVEMHAVREVGARIALQIARCKDGTGSQEQLRAAKLLAEAVGITDVVLPPGG